MPSGPGPDDGPGADPMPPCRPPVGRGSNMRPPIGTPPSRRQYGRTTPSPTEPTAGSSPLSPPDIGGHCTPRSQKRRRRPSILESPPTPPPSKSTLVSPEREKVIATLVPSYMHSGMALSPSPGAQVKRGTAILVTGRLVTHEEARERIARGGICHGWPFTLRGVQDKFKAYWGVDGGRKGALTPLRGNSGRAMACNEPSMTDTKATAILTGQTLMAVCDFKYEHWQAPYGPDYQHFRDQAGYEVAPQQWLGLHQSPPPAVVTKRLENIMGYAPRPDLVGSSNKPGYLRKYVRISRTTRTDDEGPLTLRAAVAPNEGAADRKGAHVPASSHREAWADKEAADLAVTLGKHLVVHHRAGQTFHLARGATPPQSFQPVEDKSVAHALRVPVQDPNQGYGYYRVLPFRQDTETVRRALRTHMAECYPVTILVLLTYSVLPPDIGHGEGVHPQRMWEMLLNTLHPGTANDAWAAELTYIMTHYEEALRVTMAAISSGLETADLTTRWVMDSGGLRGVPNHWEGMTFSVPDAGPSDSNTELADNVVWAASVVKGVSVRTRQAVSERWPSLGDTRNWAMVSIGAGLAPCLVDLTTGDGQWTVVVWSEDTYPALLVHKPGTDLPAPGDVRPFRSGQMLSAPASTLANLYLFVRSTTRLAIRPLNDPNAGAWGDHLLAPGYTPGVNPGEAIGKANGPVAKKGSKPKAKQRAASLQQLMTNQATGVHSVMVEWNKKLIVAVHWGAYERHTFAQQRRVRPVFAKNGVHHHLAFGPVPAAWNQLSRQRVIVEDSEELDSALQHVSRDPTLLLELTLAYLNTQAAHGVVDWNELMDTAKANQRAPRVQSIYAEEAQRHYRNRVVRTTREDRVTLYVMAYPPWFSVPTVSLLGLPEQANMATLHREPDPTDSSRTLVRLEDVICDPDNVNPMCIARFNGRWNTALEYAEGKVVSECNNILVPRSTGRTRHSRRPSDRGRHPMLVQWQGTQEYRWELRSALQALEALPPLAADMDSNLGWEHSGDPLPPTQRQTALKVVLQEEADVAMGTLAFALLISKLQIWEDHPDAGTWGPAEAAAKHLGCIYLEDTDHEQELAREVCSGSWVRAKGGAFQEFDAHDQVHTVSSICNSLPENLRTLPTLVRCSGRIHILPEAWECTSNGARKLMGVGTGVEAKAIIRWPCGIRVHKFNQTHKFSSEHPARAMGVIQDPWVLLGPDDTGCPRQCCQGTASRTVTYWCAHCGSAITCAAGGHRSENALTCQDCHRVAMEQNRWCATCGQAMGQPGYVCVCCKRGVHTRCAEGWGEGAGSTRCPDPACSPWNSQSLDATYAVCPVENCSSRDWWVTGVRPCNKCGRNICPTHAVKCPGVCPLCQKQAGRPAAGPGPRKGVQRACPNV